MVRGRRGQGEANLDKPDHQKQDAGSLHEGKRSGAIRAR
jgi:hypothetical protein